MTRIYRLATTAVASGASAGTATAVVSGRIVGSTIQFAGTGGAGIGRCTAELTLNQNATSYAETNNPNREPLLNVQTGMYGNAVSGFSIGPYKPMNVPIKAGNILNINLTISGTAPASQVVLAEVFVEE